MVADTERDFLHAVSVRARFPELTSAAAASPASVAEAIERATPDMFLHTVTERAWYAPVAYPDGEAELVSDDERTPVGSARSPLAKYGAWLHPDYEVGPRLTLRSSALRVHTTERLSLPAKTPVLVWEVDGPDVILVTLDGGRYWIGLPGTGEAPSLIAGVPPREEWPTAPGRDVLGLAGVAELARLGLVDKKAAAELEAAASGWAACARRVFARAEEEIARTDAAAFLAELTADEPFVRRYDLRARRRCKELARAEERLAEVLAVRHAERLATYARAIRRLRALGLGQ